MEVPKLSIVVDKLRTSLWPAPLAAAVLAYTLAKTLPILDATIDQDQSAWYLFVGQADSARELLSAITSSMMTFTGLVFSITILVLQLASSQFSPRVIRSFLEDAWTRTALGVFVGSFVYAMALLSEVHGEHAGHAEFVPGLSVFVAFLLIMMSVAVFIRYLHHMAHSIRVVNIVRRVADDTRRTIEHSFVRDGSFAEAELPNLGPPHTVIVSTKFGALSDVDERALLKLAARHDLFIELVPMVGDFVPSRAPLMKVWGETSPEVCEHLGRTAALRDERTPHQDPAFGLRQLVDIAERALSPGINDPTTAVQVLDQVHDLLRGLVSRPWPSDLRVDHDGRPRLLTRRLDWDGFVRLGLDEIRQYGAGSIQVLRRLRALLDDLRRVAPPERRPPLDRQLALLKACVDDHFAEPAERRVALDGSAQGHH